MTTLNHLTAVKGMRISFNYDGRERIGTIEKVGVGYCVVELDHDYEGKRYKAFHFCKMTNLSIHLDDASMEVQELAPGIER